MSESFTADIAKWQGVDDDLILQKAETLYSRAEIIITPGVGYYTSSLQNIHDVNYRCKITNPIPCKQGDSFGYNGIGRNNAVSWWIRKGTTILNTGQYIGETIVTIFESDADNIIFASFKGTSDVDSVVLSITLPYVTLEERINHSLDLHKQGYKFAGTITPASNPGSLDQDARVYFIAYQNGIYSNYGNIEKTETTPIYILWNGTSFVKHILPKAQIDDNNE